MDWLADHTWVAWLGLAVLLGAGEMITLELTLAMLSVGALAGMTAGLLSAPFVLQVLVALGASGATLGLLRPRLIARLHGGPELVLGTARLLGSRGVVSEDVSRHAGLVRLGGDTWTARPYDDTLTLPAGTEVEVMEIRGATALVHPVHGYDPLDGPLDSPHAGPADEPGTHGTS
ncbi:NfeD family protein [Nocardioides sp. GY 10127]|uniref:NfeD family protein n=1 Tax=Nocardioides sp. GY 10127 TaxID=2569762 RepID=UPI0010A7D4C4|nr:NfeD family protein [Nocardioides sp. GY 10127]TIC86521.1 NfeD family protein [Nocardioides sp. GY 10127]